MAEDIAYKSFCWSLGTTSFRTKNFNSKIEYQLKLLDEFWNLSENMDASWTNNNDIQEKYYLFMQQKGFVKGDAPRKAKDAREKTSGLVSIGLIDKSRRLTNAGRTLLDINLSGDFSSNNALQIPKDSFLYFKQLLKTSCEINNEQVRPYVVLNYVLSKVEYLSLDEFKFLLPLCTNKNNTKEIIQGIFQIRNGTSTIDGIIISKLMSMSNYEIALRQFLSSNVVDEQLICTIGLNRKSRVYDKGYLNLYKQLYMVYVAGYVQALPYVYEAARKIKIGRYWIGYIFNTVSNKKIKRCLEECKKPTIFDNVTTEGEFRTSFFKIMHLFKAKATLSDYFDLNRRYFKTTDTVIFDDGKVYFDIVPKQFLNSVADELFNYAFTYADNLQDNCALTEIAPCLVIEEETIISGINEELGLSISSMTEARQAVMDERHRRFNELIDSRFDDDTLIGLLDKFEQRNDNEIMSIVTDNADIPTIFEYVLGIIWYKISGRQGNILEYMNLSLEADLLPKTHAGGGMSDIVYRYQATADYPKHDLLIECTLMEGSTQRRGEMEPVSRHLLNYMIDVNKNSYCTFVSNNLHASVISDFRMRKNSPLYRNDTEYVYGMKIIPLHTSELKVILAKSISYGTLYTLFDSAYNNTSIISPPQWYDVMIKNKVFDI